MGTYLWQPRARRPGPVRQFASRRKTCHAPPLSAQRSIARLRRTRADGGRPVMSICDCESRDASGESQNEHADRGEDGKEETKRAYLTIISELGAELHRRETVPSPMAFFPARVASWPSAPRQSALLVRSRRHHQSLTHDGVFLSDCQAWSGRRFGDAKLPVSGKKIPRPAAEKALQRRCTSILIGPGTCRHGASIRIRWLDIPFG